MVKLPANGRYAMFLRKSREDAEAERAGKFETLAKHRAVLERLAESMGVAISQFPEPQLSGVLATVINSPSINYNNVL